MSHTIENKSGTFCVYAWGTYPASSVLAGQARKTYVDGFDTLEEATASYPDASVGYRSANNSVAHLPGENDPVAGGMYADDYGDDA